MKMLFRILGGLLGTAFVAGCLMKLYVFLYVTPEFTAMLGLQIAVQALLGFLFLNYAFRSKEVVVEYVPPPALTEEQRMSRPIY